VTGTPSQFGPVLATVTNVVAVLLLLVAQSWRQKQATGSAGFNGFTGLAAALPDRIGGISFVLALLAGLLSPILAAASWLPRLVEPASVAAIILEVLGVLLAVAGLILGVTAQRAMGVSWRIGVNPTERTKLVVTGPFATIRNPIFSALLAVQIGVAVIVPTWLSITAVAVLLAACQIQVRFVEEPYLRRTHRRSYDEYASRTGRFIPGVGRLTTAGYS
jgi:protein-S-isoprenylcysteine O-methyltransferase Ste14